MIAQKIVENPNIVILAVKHTAKQLSYLMFNGLGIRYSWLKWANGEILQTQWFGSTMRLQDVSHKYETWLL